MLRPCSDGLVDPMPSFQPQQEEKAITWMVGSFNDSPNLNLK